mgnify:CR=1 FL=1
MKGKITLLTLLVTTSISLAQFSQDFAAPITINNAGSLSGETVWGQFSSTGVTWAHNSTVGNVADGSMVTSVLADASGSGFLWMPYLDLSAYIPQSLSITFNYGLVGETGETNSPSLTFFYRSPNPRATTGNFRVISTHSIGTGNADATLENSDINWQTVTFSDLTTLPDQNVGGNPPADLANIQFSFGATFDAASNGWALIDDVVIAGTLSSDGDFKLSKQISLYPNPSAGKFNVSFKDPQSSVSLKVYDITGKLVVSKNYKSAKQFSFSLDSFPRGVYLSEIVTPSGSYTNKLVKN